jgi:hypothetical protein
LWVDDIDGSSPTNLYTQAADADYSDQDTPFLGNKLAWSFDSTKIAVVDSRDPAPIWMFDIVAGTRTKVWNGSGWDNPDDQIWLYDLVNFDTGGA